MPVLSGFIRPCAVAPGFRVPTFQQAPGWNLLSIQAISISGHISAFSEYNPRSVESLCSLTGPTSEVGDRAVWIFEELDGELFIGDEETLKRILAARVEARAYSQYPFLASEVALFCGDATLASDEIRTAYRRLTAISAVSAEQWRNHVFLLPAIRKELAIYANSEVERSSIIENTSIEVHGSSLLVEGVAVPPGLVDLSKIFQVASLFDLAFVSVPTAGQDDIYVETERPQHNSKAEPDEDVDGSNVGAVVALGGVARFAVTNALGIRNTGVGRTLLNGSIDAQVLKLQDYTRDRADVSNPLVVVFGSDHKLADSALTITKDHPGLKIAIVIRPIGYGAHSGRKLDCQDIETLANSFDVTWVVVNHRVRHPQGPAPNMAASRIVSRSVQAALQSVTLPFDLATRWFNGEPRQKSLISIVGASSWNRDWSVDENVSEAIVQVLSDEFVIRDGSLLTVIVPEVADAPVGPLNATIGRRRVFVQVERAAFLRRRAIAVASDVDTSGWRQGWLSDIVAFLLERGGWSEPRWTDNSISYQRYGRLFVLYIASTLSDLEMFLAYLPNAATDVGSYHAVVTNQTVSEEMKRLPIDVVQFSQLQQWSSWAASTHSPG